ncbi:MAG: helix-turn-helix domain-containing protein [Thermoanaerobaculia bacterium]
MAASDAICLGSDGTLLCCRLPDSIVLLVTRLDTFLSTNELRPADVARESGVSRQHLLRLRTGSAAPTITTAVRIRDACGRLLRRQVRLAELFEVE